MEYKVGHINKHLFNELINLINKYTIEEYQFTEEEFWEQIIFFLVTLMKRKQEVTDQYKNKPEVLLEGFSKFIELKE